MVRGLLEESGIRTIDADSVGHSVLEPDGPAFREVAERWPDVVDQGKINRDALGSIVFSDPGELAALEAITHPHIFDRIRGLVEGIEDAVVVEIPLLHHGLDDSWRRIVVDSRDGVRLSRAVDRGMSEADARARLRVQASREEWLRAADLVVPNHASPEDLRSTVAKIIPKL